MPVTSITELFDGRSGTFSPTEGRRYVRAFRVLTNAITDGPQTVKAAIGIKYGDPYQGLGLVESESDQFAYVTSIDAVQEDGDSIGWIVTVTYDWFSSIYAGGGPDANPLLFPIDVTWSYRNQEIVAQYDNNGNAILNTAGDPFDPPVVIDDPRPMLTIVRNEATFNVPLNNQYRTAVNSDPFATYNAQMARVIQISGKPLFHQVIGWYWQVTYEFEFNPPLGYRPKLRYLSAFTGKQVPILVNGIPVSFPLLLNKQGQIQKPGDTPYYVQPQIYPELPFSVFNFDPIVLAGQRSGFNTTYQGALAG
jgi:hypothetical protein